MEEGIPVVAIRSRAACRPRSSVFTIFARHAIPRLALVHTEVDGIRYEGSAFGIRRNALRGKALPGGELRKGCILARRTIFTVLPILPRRPGLTILSVLAGSARLSVFTVLSGCTRLSVGTILPVQTVGADGITTGIGQQLAVQRPIPIAVFPLHDADLRRFAVSPLRALLPPPRRLAQRA